LSPGIAEFTIHRVRTPVKGISLLAAADSPRSRVRSEAGRGSRRTACAAPRARARLLLLQCPESFVGSAAYGGSPSRRVVHGARAGSRSALPRPADHFSIQPLQGAGTWQDGDRSTAFSPRLTDG